MENKKELKLFSLAWPIFIETALFMLLGFIDVFVLSKYDDLAASSVNTANQAVSIVTIVFTVISGASAVLISQSLGAGNKKGASRIAALSITFSLIFGIIISAILMFFNKPILSFIGATGQILEFGSQVPFYCRWIFISTGTTEYYGSYYQKPWYDSDFYVCNCWYEYYQYCT